jgi:hypothetical protein
MQSQINLDKMEPNYVEAARTAARKLLGPLHEAAHRAHRPEWDCNLPSFHMLVAAALFQQMVAKLDRDNNLPPVNQESLVIALRAFLMMCGASADISTERVPHA